MGEIRENQQVKLSFNLFDGSEKEVTCRIKSFHNDRISLKPTTSLDAYIEYLQEGNEVKAKIFTPLGVKVYEAMVINSPLEDEFVIEYVENTVQIQRREYLRMPYQVKLVIERNNKEVIITQTVDISGGGVRFFHGGAFEEDELVKASLYIPDERLIKAQGLILPHTNIPEGQYALFFDEIDERDRDRIIKKCFELQLIVE